MPATELLTIVATAVFLARLLPQPFRLARTGVVEGLSAMAALNALVSAAAWLAYGLQVGLAVVWISAVIALVPSTWQAVLLRHRVSGRDLAGAGLFATALVVAAGLGVLGIALGGTVLVTMGPQVRTALSAPDLSGLAPATYWVALVDAAAWGSYGMAVHDGALIGYFVALVSAAVIILGRITWTERLQDRSR